MHIRSLFRIQFLITALILFGVGVAIAQSDIQPVFTPSISQKVDARTAPAKVTTENESALIGKGYVKIGAISASQPGKKASAEVTEQLESAILQKSAAVGGDVVRFSKVGSYEEREVPTGKSKYKGGTCDQYSTQSVSTTTSSQSCYTDVHGFAHCTTWNTPGFSTRSTCVHKSGGYEVPITKREKYLVSEGTVWRYDPKPAVNVSHRDSRTPFISPSSTSVFPEHKESIATMYRHKDVTESHPVQDSGGINARDSEGYTPLIRAIRNSKREEAQVLLEHGADVNEPAGEPAHDKGWTPLLEASIFMPGLMKTLVERGANVNATDSGNNIALFWAACSDDQEIIKLMLAKGAKIDMQDSIDQTPLIHAASCAALENVKLLLASGANMHLKEYDGKTAADVAQEEMGKAKTSEDKAKYQQIIQLLRQ